MAAPASLSAGSSGHDGRRSEGLAGKSNGAGAQEGDASLPIAEQPGVLCANVAGKVVAKAVRLQLVEPLAVEAGARQHGAYREGALSFRHMLAAEGPLGRGDQVREHHCQAAGCGVVLAQDGSGLPQGPLVLGFGLAEASSHFCWH